MAFDRPAHHAIAMFITGVMAVIAVAHHIRFMNMMTFDVYGYYVYLPAAISFGDLKDFSFVADHFATYPMGSGPFQILDVANGSMPAYTMGLAYLQLPFYLLGEFFAILTGAARDGLSRPYQWTFLLGGLSYCYAGYYFLSKWLYRKVSNSIRLWTLIAIAFGTNYLIYSAFDIGLTHAYIFSLYAILLYHSERWLIDHNKRSGYILALVISLLCLIRPTEVICILLPIIYAASRGILRSTIKANWKQLIGMLLICMLLVLPQMLIWKSNTDQWIFNAYAAQGHTFHFDGRFIWEGLFSYRKGWLLYTPIMLLAFIGFIRLYKEEKHWFWPILIYTMAHIFLVFSWNMWWYASSFSCRPMVHAYAALALPLAFVFSLKKPWKWPLILIGGGLLIFNLFQCWQYEKGILPGDGINKIFYAKTFGVTKKDKARIKYVDLDEYLPNIEAYKKFILARKNWSDTSSEVSIVAGRLADVITPERQFGAPLVFTVPASLDTGDHWLNVSAKTYRKGDQYNAWHIAELAVSFIDKNGQTLKSDGIRFPFFIDENIWGQSEFEVRIPEEAKAGDMIKVYVWNHSPDTIHVSELGLDLLVK